jgi:CheY-like chemotaxis protein
MYRVLVVDDEPQILRALVINLRARAYQVDTAPDGTTALRLAADRRPDAIILDLGLPDMDGADVISGIRGWARVPVIVLSARHSSEEKILLVHRSVSAPGAQQARPGAQPQPSPASARRWPGASAGSSAGTTGATAQQASPRQAFRRLMGRSTRSSSSFRSHSSWLFSISSS